MGMQHRGYKKVSDLEAHHALESVEAPAGASLGESAQADRPAAPSANDSVIPSTKTSPQKRLALGRAGRALTRLRPNVRSRLEPADTTVAV